MAAGGWGFSTMMQLAGLAYAERGVSFVLLFDLFLILVRFTKVT
jgi:hypothetical protein